MSDYNVGPGVQQAIADTGDAARSDELFIVNEPDGQKISQTICRDSVFYWIQEDNAVRRTPFPG
jgi:hypothetical protein